MRKTKIYSHHFDQRAKDDIKAYKKVKDFHSLKMIWDLIGDIEIHGELHGKGSPERLRRDLKGFYSREINKIDRLIYRIVGNTIEIIGCKGHYYV